MSKTQMRAALATLSRYVLARAEETRRAGVDSKPLDDQYAMIQRAKEGQPEALLAARQLWDGITATAAGRAALLRCFRAA